MADRRVHCGGEACLARATSRQAEACPTRDECGQGGWVRPKGWVRARKGTRLHSVSGGPGDLSRLSASGGWRAGQRWGSAVVCLPDDTLFSQHIKQGVYAGGVQLGAGDSEELRLGVLHRHGGAVRTLGGEGIQGIGGGDDARVQGYIVAGEAVGV